MSWRLTPHRIISSLYSRDWTRSSFIRSSNTMYTHPGTSSSRLVHIISGDLSFFLFFFVQWRKRISYTRHTNSDYTCFKHRYMFTSMAHTHIFYCKYTSDNYLLQRGISPQHTSISPSQVINSEFQSFEISSTCRPFVTCSYLFFHPYLYEYTNVKK